MGSDSGRAGAARQAGEVVRVTIGATAEMWARFWADIEELREQRRLLEWLIDELDQRAAGQAAEVDRCDQSGSD